ncbi:TIGR02680 family protein [Dactylosporangium darangshiense]|uniref:TIGR02680 family protein n=1 Tax=Dactylosporangium darangshiense TaxID=579108 RepID=A0ABP8DHX7_9ACTN
MTTDAQLVEWRDAATSGGLPQPYRRDRWQPLRAGVVNLWEYDAAEVWYADGRMQLQGANESGKSTLMTLTTLLLLAGDTGSRNIDTLGESGKRFRYYVEPSDHPLDRRDATRQKHRGWAWQEYGRQTDGDPEYFTTLLFAEARRTDASLKTHWCTLHGRHRVRAGLTLLSAGLVAEPQQLRDIEGFVLHRTGAAYREAIARTMFGTASDLLDQVVRILRVVRTPKIGDRLDLAFLTTAFRNALPPLAEDEIRQLAEGWDQLERLRSDRDTAEQALAAVEEFTRKSWRPWADAVIRAAADPVTAAVTAFDNVTREERLAREAASALERQVTELAAQITADDVATAHTRAELEALQQEQAYQDAVTAIANADQLAERAREAVRLAQRSEQRARDTIAKVGPARVAAETAATDLREGEASVDAAANRVAAEAEPAGLTDVAARFLPGRDTARLDQAARRRQAAVTRILQLLDIQADAQRALDEAVRVATQARTEATAAAALADTAGEEVTRTIEAVAAALGAWAARLPDVARPTPEAVEAWVGLVSGLADADRPRPVVAAAIARDHLDSIRRTLQQRSAELASQLQQNTRAQQDLTARLAAVEQERDPRPAEPALWRRRDRPDGVTDGGAPLWRLVEVIDDADGTDVATLEAALEASGLLQAWVTPDGAYQLERDGADTVWIAGDRAAPGISHTLRAVLRPADDAGVLTDTVDRLLRNTAYSPTPSAAPALSPDGQWWHGTLTGRAIGVDGGPRLLGAAARAADRRRRIVGLRAELADLRATAEAITNELADVDQLLERLAEAARLAPDDAPVVAAVLTLRHAEREAERLARKAADGETAARDAQDRLDGVVADVVTHADEHRLPRRPGEVEATRLALYDFASVVSKLADAVGRLPRLREIAVQFAGAYDEAERLATTAQEDAETDRAEAERLQVQAAAAASALAQDAQEILARVADLRKNLGQLEGQVKLLRAERDQVLSRQFKAQSTLESVEEQRSAAEAERQRAVDSWFACVDAGLPALRHLPDPSARNVTAARESARAARAAIHPRDWSDEPQVVAKRVQARWASMVDTAQELRSRLESLSGRTVRTKPADEDDPGAVDVVVDGTGAALPPPTAVDVLARLLERLSNDYDEELSRTINELLGSTFIEHLRDRLVEAERLRTDINAKLAQTPTTTSGLILRLVRAPVEGERAANDVLAALERDFGLLPAGTQDQIRQFLSRRIGDAQEAARASGDADWRAQLERILDYRRWFELRLEYRTAQATANGAIGWRPLNRDDHSLLSGGAKVVTLLQPFVAALHAMYDQSGIGPRMMWLDEAFDGVDPANRATMLRLLADCDLDWVVAGPATIANTPTVPMAAIYEVRRAPRPFPGVSLELAVWAGGELTHLVTPDPADLPDLFSELQT